MEYFNRFYLWGVNTKYRMGLYFAAAVFCKGITAALQGEFSIDSLILLEMVLLCFVFAGLETAIFPAGRDWSGEGQGRRTALWAALGNGIYIGGAWALGWFPGIPPWGAAVLVLFLEAGLLAMWYALWLKLKWDTEFLNCGLRRFQTGQARRTEPEA